jgi:hypothetical protein
MNIEKEQIIEPFEKTERNIDKYKGYSVET